MPDPDEHQRAAARPGPLRRLAGLALKLAAALVVALLLVELSMRLLGLRLPARMIGGDIGVMLRVPESEAPHLGHALQPGAVGEHVYPGRAPGEERRVVYRINQDGFRDRRYARPKPPGTFRIAFLGDSVTYGTGIGADDTVAKLLEARFAERLPGRAVEIMNCGVPATNTRQQVALLEWRVLDFEPDLVFVCSTIVDASGLGAEKEEDETWEVRVVNALGLTSGVFEDQPRTPAQERMMALRRVSVLVDSLAHHTYRLLQARVQIESYHRDWRAGSRGVELIRRSLTRARQLADERGFALHCGMYPFLTRLSGGYPFEPETARLAGICAELDVPFHDLLEPLRGQDPARLQAHSHDRHPNRRANELVAGWLLERLLPVVQASD